MNHRTIQNRGFGLVEMVVGTSILVLVLFAVSTFFQSALRASMLTKETHQANFLLEEGVEVLKILRDEGYTTYIGSCSTTTPYYMVWNGTDWTLATSSVMVDNFFTRSVTFTDVVRDSNDDIAFSGTYDPNTKRAVVTVSWTSLQGEVTRSVATYITNLFSN